MLEKKCLYYYRGTTPRLKGEDAYLIHINPSGSNDYLYIVSSM